MADSPTEQRVLNNIAEATEDNELVAPQQEKEFRPSYKKFTDAKIPVSKRSGNLWRSRKDAAFSKLKNSGKLDAWQECIAYYKNDQKVLRGEIKDASTGTGRRRRTRRIGEYGGSETENIVFANTSSLVPSIYAKNPTCEITPNLRDDNSEGGEDDEIRTLADVGERLVNALADKRAAPGLALKKKMRKAVIMTCLTNLAYIEIGYTQKENATEAHLNDLGRIAQELEQATEPQKIEQLEGELIALEEIVDFLTPAGPFTKFRHPADVLYDPDSSGIEDAKWVMIADYVSTSYLNAVYREDAGDGKWKSIYKPTHIARADEGSVEDQINNFSLIGDNNNYKAYGYRDESSYNKALRTKVWKVWDKTTRRVYMFNDEDWSWPIWVWDDPYNLDTFFPIYPLEFYTDPEEDIANSEVSYYLDQQDEINIINDELHKMRDWVRKNIIYNKNVFPDATVIEKFLEGGQNATAIGVNVPTDVDLNKAFVSMPPPSAQFIQLFDKSKQLEAIQRVSSVTEVMQGVQFKTNTTNDAISTYNSQTQTRLDEKIDAVEDCIGNVLWGVLQLCLQFMTKDEVAVVLGPQDGERWTNLSPDDIRSKFSVRIVGGSSVKPTSKAKKEEALKMGQVLGQFANAGQGATIMIMLKVLERAFDEVVITKEDWAMLAQAISASIQNSNPQGQAQQGAAPAEIPPEVMQMIQQLPPEMQQVIQQLPQEAQQAFIQSVGQGVPPEQALQEIMQLLQQQGAPA